MTQLQVAIQRTSDTFDYPSDEEIESWTGYVLQQESRQPDPVELAVRLVDTNESAELNEQFRNKEGPTNVLSFPFESPPGLPEPLSSRILGDIVICAPVVATEAQQQQKTLKSHWAHMLVHGTLHLLGYDHQNDKDAQQMESRETALLAHFNINNPYR